MARIAALSGAGSFAQAVTTWDSSCPNEATGICESLCESPFEFPKEAGVFRRFKSCRSDHLSHGKRGSSRLPHRFRQNPIGKKMKFPKVIRPRKAGVMICDKGNSLHYYRLAFRVNGRRR